MYSEKGISSHDRFCARAASPIQRSDLVSAGLASNESMSRSQPVKAGEWLDSVIITIRRVFGLMLAIGPITWLFTRQTCYSVLISVGYRFRVFGVSVAGTEVFALAY